MTIRQAIEFVTRQLALHGSRPRRVWCTPEEFNDLRRHWISEMPITYDIADPMVRTDQITVVGVPFVPNIRH